ncbi:MAG TPA: hypothetical protein VK465_07275 [Fibrobacteria bacterium]|nr:hypothetical protein [Fibrobacteria bacterium]
MRVQVRGAAARALGLLSFVLVLVLSLPVGTPLAAGFEDIGKVGLAIKAGECAGPMGAQASWNLSGHWQLATGVGGANPLASVLERARFRTDSYYALGKYYFEHLYLAAGYTYWISKARVESGGRFEEDEKSEHGLPIHLGYEFGKRKGFFFSTSIGYVFVPWGGGRTLEVILPGARAINQTPDSGPSVGASVGYYFDAFK